MKVKTQVCAGVSYTVEVLENGRVVKSTKPKRNLVLDQGLNQMATVRPVNLTAYVVVGTGTDPVKRDSGSTTVTVAGTAATASGNFFVAQDVGRLIKLDSGEERYITAFIDAQNVTLNAALAAGPSEFTIWYVNQLGLVTESKRSNNKLVGTGNNTRTYAGGGQWDLKRTVIFPAEAAPITYNEIGWSNTAAAGANLFGRDLIQPGVSLLTGQQLKVTVTLHYTIGPVVKTAFVNGITGGFGDAGEYGYQAVQANNTGNVDDITSPWLPCEAGAGTMRLSDTSAALVAVAAQTGTVDINGASGGLVGSSGSSVDPYVSGTFQKTFRFTWDVNAANRTTNRSFGDGSDPGGGQWRLSFRGMWNSNQTKTSDYTLRMDFTVSWGRVLTN